MTFDSTLIICAHVVNIVSRAKQQLSILNALAGTLLGQQKESLRATYKASIRSLFTYSTPIWFLFTSNSNISKLQQIQNATC